MVPKCEKSCLQQGVLRVDMMQYFIGIKKTPFLSAHVDDFCWAGTKLFQNIVINHIRNAFTVSKEELQTFKYLGLSISQTNDGIFMHQNEYIEEIEVVEIDKPNQKDHKLLPHETQQLRRVAGQLNWVSTQTRPDMAYAAPSKMQQ